MKWATARKFALGAGPRAPKRLLLSAAAAIAFLVGFVGLRVRDQSSPHSVSLQFGVLVVLVAFGGLADMPALIRAPATILLAFPWADLAGQTKWDRDMGDQALQVLLLVGGLLATAIGIIVPVRLYVGTIGRPRCNEAPRGPSVASLLGAVSFYAVAAALLTSALLIGNFPHLAMAAALAAAIALGASLAVLGESEWMLAVGICLLGGASLAAYGVGVTLPSAHLVPLAPFVAVVYAGEMLGPMLAAGLLLRANGFRFRR